MDTNSKVSIKIDDENLPSKSDQSLMEDNYQIKIKTMKKEFLDQDTKLQVELIDEDGQSIVSRRGNDLQKGIIDTFTIDTPEHFGKVNYSFSMSFISRIF